MIMTVANQAKSMEELFDAEVARKKKDMKPDEHITRILISVVGRPDFGHQYMNKMKEANIPMADDVVISVYNGGMFAVVASSWGEMSVLFVVEKV